MVAQGAVGIGGWPIGVVGDGFTEVGDGGSLAPIAEPLGVRFFEEGGVVPAAGGRVGVEEPAS